MINYIQIFISFVKNLLKNKKRYNDILRTLNKKTNSRNRKILLHIENDIFEKEKKENKHKDTYFYKFVFYKLADHLEDRKTFLEIIKELNWFQLIVNILVVLFIIYLAIYYILCYNISIGKWFSGIAILITSIITGSFFLIKIYIQNELTKKELHMKNMWEKALEKQTDEQNQKFKSLENKLDTLLSLKKTDNRQSISYTEPESNLSYSNEKKSNNN